MPTRSPHPCSQPGCAALVKRAARCAEHAVSYARKRYQDQDAARPSPSKRGYGPRWQTYRKWFLSQPENILCACGCGRLSQEVDHIIPVRGPGDPLFWEPTNHQGLTKTCHSRKTATQDSAFAKAGRQADRY